MVRTKLAQIIVAFTLIVSIGGHWAMLQSVGWLGMIASYSRDASILVALEKTFDGDHPCKICRIVQAGKKSEKQEASVKVQTKLDLWVVANMGQLNPPRSTVPVFAVEGIYAPRSESPPTPPPRLV